MVIEVGTGTRIEKETEEEKETRIRKGTVTETGDTEQKVESVENVQSLGVQKTEDLEIVKGVHQETKKVVVVQEEESHLFTGMYRHQDLNTLLHYRYELLFEKFLK